MQEVKLAALDVWVPGVRAVVRECLPDGWTIAFADSYETVHQQTLAAGADVIIPGLATVDAAMLASAPKLRMIQKWGIGLDRIDLDAVERSGITLAITAGANASVVAEHAIMLILATYRRLSLVDRAARQGNWMFDQMRGVCQRLGGKTVGLVGFGHIGQMMARKLAGFDVTILYNDLIRPGVETETRLNASYVSLPDLLSQSDVVSLHIPGGAENRHLIDASALALMKSGAILVNTARGEIVDEAALAAAIQSGQLMGAGLDTFEPEPPEPGNALLQLDEVVVTPHTAGSVIDNVPNVARHAFDNIRKFLDGEALPAADLVLPR